MTRGATSDPTEADGRLAEEGAIRRLVDRYCDAVNRHDWDTLADCWAEDGVWDLGEPINVRKVGAKEILDEVRPTVEAQDFYVQMAHGGVISVDGGQATARWTINEIARGKVQPGTRQSGMFILAYYSDDLVKGTDGAWRFAKRSYRVVYFDDSPPQGVSYPVLQELREAPPLPR